MPLGKSTSNPSLLKSASASSVVDVSKIPNLPGTDLRRNLEKSYFPRQNSFSMKKGVRIEREPGFLAQKRSKFVKTPKEVTEYDPGCYPLTSTRSAFDTKNLTTPEYDELPAWDVLDRHVLRFYAYGKETVGETNLENYRVQPFKILYYLQDDTIQISAPKADNSGLGVYAAVGGPGDKGLSANLLKRGKLSKADGSLITASDFQIGEEFEFLGRKVFVYECDDFTRQYYEAMGKPLNPADPSDNSVPSDAFGASLAKKKQSMAAPMLRTAEKMYTEAMLNGGHINANMQDFMEKDKHVMRFYAIMDDLQTPQFERRPFIINYFLADKKVQIREQYPLNSGRDGFPLFCKKQRLPRGLKPEVRGPMHSAYQEEDYVCLDDLFVGGTLECFNQKLFIYDADEFTRKHYLKNRGQELGEAIDVRLPEPKPVVHPVPPYTGLGSWEDSMGSVNMLRPKKPKKDLAKLFFNDGKTLRFSAKFSGSVAEEDVMRRFLISYYLYDDCIMVHEPPQRNLGIVTGRFLEKAVHLNQLSGVLFHPNDFKVGNEIKVLSHQFLILDMDEYTRNYFKMLEAGEDTHPANTNLNDVLKRLRQAVREQQPQMQAIFRRFDADRNGVLCYHEIERMLQKFGFHLSPEETLCIMKYFDPKGEGQIDYNTFCSTCFDDDFGYEKKSNEVKINAAELQGYADVAAQKTIDRAETEKVRRAVRNIQDIYVNRTNMTVRLTAEFAHLTHEQFVNWEQIRTAFVRLGYVFEPEDVQRCVKYLMPGTDLNRINYNLFLQQLRITYSDMTAAR